MPSLRRFRAVPWVLVLAAARVIWDHWQRIDERDRHRATQILTDARGIPMRMTDKERSELVSIARRLDAVGLGRDLAATASPIPIPGLRTKNPKKKK